MYTTVFSVLSFTMLRSKYMAFLCNIRCLFLKLWNVHCWAKKKKWAKAVCSLGLTHFFAQKLIAASNFHYFWVCCHVFACMYMVYCHKLVVLFNVRSEYTESGEVTFILPATLTVYWFGNNESCHSQYWVPLVSAVSWFISWLHFSS